MRNLISIFLILLVTLGMLINHADARRFGGGRSFGFQRPASSYSMPRAAAQSIQPPQANKWLGPLAGLAAGGLLASLFMGHGLGSGLLSWLAIAGVGFMIWNFIRNKFQPAAQSNSANENTAHSPASQFTNNSSYSSSNKVYPADFDPEIFLREAKVQFIRLQTAYDSKNLADIREFTAPEVFGEIQLQLQERGDAPNITEVIKLDAELLDVGIESQATIASVRFSGSTKENTDAPTSFNEIWHLRKYATQSNWVVAGVQQQ